MKIKKGLEKEYEEYVEKNSKDGYSRVVVDATEDVGQALDEGKTCEEAEKATFGHGLTGYMAGALAHAIVYFHPRGEEFKKYWNKQWGVEDENAKRVVNPAIMTIGEKDE